MKGLLKGLRYFSQMFEEQKEPEIQIGAPTDVKHVAHIGWDGPSSVETPSWMKEFKTSEGFEATTVGAPGNSRENRDTNRVNEGKHTIRDLPDLPKSSRPNNHPSQDNYLGAQSPSRDPNSTTKTKHSRRHHSKDSSDGHKATSLEPDQSPSRNLPDIPKKSRRKKSKESINVGPSKSSRSKINASNSTRERMEAPYSDPGPCREPILGSNKDNNDICQNSSSKPFCTRGNEGK